MNEFLQEDLDRKITLKKGDIAPNFELKNQDGVNVNLRDFAGKKIILYFYPKDDTPGCTTQACDFTSNFEVFNDKDSVIIGISPDSVKSHLEFTKKYNLKHTLLSDENKEVSKMYGVWQVRKNFGKEYLGIARSTFIIDENGKIEKIYKNVTAAEHAQKVLNDL